MAWARAPANDSDPAGKGNSIVLRFAKSSPRSYCGPMTTLSFTLDDVAAARVQTAARRRHTTVETLFVKFVGSLTSHDVEDVGDTNDEAAAQLAHTFQALSRPLGGKGYTTRDELYER